MKTEKEKRKKYKDTPLLLDLERSDGIRTTMRRERI